MNTIIGVLITFLVIILVLYLVNMLPIDGRAKQIVRVIVIILGVISLLNISPSFEPTFTIAIATRRANFGSGACRARFDLALTSYAAGRDRARVLACYRTRTKSAPRAGCQQLRLPSPSSCTGIAMVPTRAGSTRHAAFCR